MKYRAIAINRLLEKEELEQVRKLEGQVPVYLFDSKLKFDFTVLNVELEPAQKKELNYQLLSRILNLGDKKIAGKRVADYFDYGSGNAWYYHKFRTYFFVRNLYYEIEKLEQVRYHSDQLLFFCDNRFKNIEAEFEDIDFVAPPKHKESFNVGTLFNYTLFFGIRSLLGFFSRNKASRNILIEAEKHTPVLDYHSLKPSQGNYLSDYLLEKSGEELSVFTEVGVPKFKGGGKFPLHASHFSFRRKNAPKFFIEHILLRGLFSFDVRKRLKENEAVLRENYAALINGADDLFESLVFRHYQSLHSTTSFFIRKNLSFVKFFQQNSIKSILASDENSPTIKSILDAATFCGIPTVGIQHGTMHDLHPAYLYTRDDRDRKIMTDYTLAWGSYWKNFMVEKGNFPADSVKVVGQIRTDIIPKLKRATPNIPEVPAGKKIIVFASQPQRDPELRRRAAFDCFTAAKAFDDAFLVVKLHPNEFGDVDYYKSIADEAGCTNFAINLTTDLYLLISQCDMLITCFSTVGTETIYFKKPLIILDHLAQDIQGYRKEEVAFQAKSHQELRLILKGILYDDLRIDEKKQERFINKYANTIDGKVSERILEFIEDI